MEISVLLENKKTPISQRLKQARIDAGLSQKSLGIEAGIDRFSASARMNQYETDKHVPDYGTIKRIAAVLGVPTAYFYCEDDDLAEVIKLWSKLSAKQKHNIFTQ